MDSLLQDLKFAIRQLWKDKGFLVTAGLTLALCVGANATIFSVVNSVILRPLPVAEPEALVIMWNAYPGAMGEGARGGNGVPDFYDRRELTEVFEGVAAYDPEGRVIDLQGTPQRVTALDVTPSFFRLLRAEAAVGRVFTEAEGEHGNNQAVVLSDGLWQQLYGGDPSVVGSDVRVDGREFRIVGVMPADFLFLDQDVRMWTALAFDPERRYDYHSNNFNMLARLQPGATLEQAQQQVDALNLRNMDLTPELKPLLIDAGFHTPLFRLQEDVVRDVRGVLFMLWGGVAFVLLIGCVNVVNLVLVRSTARSKEIATRFALGARRRRVARQLLTEIMVLTVAGGALGILFAQAGLSVMGGLGLNELPRAGEIRLDAVAIAFTMALALVVGLVVALIPLASTWRVDLSSVFREEGRTGTAGRGVRLLRKGLVAVQVAFALILLAGAGLLLASFQQMLAVDPGFEPEGVLTGAVGLPGSRYPDGAAVQSFIDEALAEIGALPGVQHAGMTSQIPFGDGFSDSVILAEGYVAEPGESVISPGQNYITPGYFEAMGMTLAAGRGFDDRDTRDGQPVIIIDQQLADRFFTQGEVVGKRMRTIDEPEDILNADGGTFFTIVGVVETIRMRGLTGVDMPGSYYFPLAQQARRGIDIAVKTAGDPNALIGSVRGVISGIDTELPLFDIRTMEERVGDSLTNRRTPMLLTAMFSAVALLLAAVGIYGVLAYLVQMREKEIGIRVALGSGTAGVFGLVLREGVAILAIGVAAGLAGAFALSRFIESQLYQVSAADPVVLLLVAAVLSAVALVACLIPARRATRIDPVEALRA
jgi:predicted permease